MLPKSAFNDDAMSLTVYRDGHDRCPYLLLRTSHMAQLWFSLRGAHQLVVDRDGGALHFKRWSKSEKCPKLWAVLYFITWEGMMHSVTCEAMGGLSGRRGESW